MSPQNWLCRSERNSALDTQAPNSPLVHINGDNAYSPQIPDVKLTVTSKFNSYNCDMSFVKNAKVQSLTSDNTRCFLNISWHHFVSTLTSLNSTSLAAPKANHIPCCNKNLFIKTPFDLRHLTSSSTTLYISNNTLSEETLQRKHTYVTNHSSLTNNKNWNAWIREKKNKCTCFYFLSRRINIVNWITMTRKSGEHLRTIYGNTGQLFWPYWISLAVYTVISTTGDRTSDHRLQCRISTTEPRVHIPHKWR